LFWACIVVSDFNPDFASVFSLAAQGVPQVILAATWNHDFF
jgi:hypothetical protein